MHHAVLKQNDAVIRLLLYDPRVNPLLKNIDGFFAHQFIDDRSPQKLLELNSLFFIRSRLDIVVDEETSTLRKASRNITGSTVNGLLL